MQAALVPEVGEGDPERAEALRRELEVERLRHAQQPHGPTLPAAPPATFRCQATGRGRGSHGATGPDPVPGNRSWPEEPRPRRPRPGARQPVVAGGATALRDLGLDGREIGRELVEALEPGAVVARRRAAGARRALAGEPALELLLELLHLALQLAQALDDLIGVCALLLGGLRRRPAAATLLDRQDALVDARVDPLQPLEHLLGGRAAAVRVGLAAAGAVAGEW